MNASAERIAETADSVLSANPKRNPMHAKMSLHREMIIAGAMWEMSIIRPSYPEMGKLLGCAHSVCITHIKHWHDLPWDERYGWLKVIDYGMQSTGSTKA